MPQQISSYSKTSQGQLLPPVTWGEYLASAYPHIPIYPPHRCFAVGDDHFQFVALPFGLSSVSRVFTKVLAHPKAQGIQVLSYLNKLLLIDCPFQLYANLYMTIQMLQAFGWVINFQNSALQPCFHLKYLGLDKAQPKAFLPERNLLSQNSCSGLEIKEMAPSVGCFMRVLGFMVDAFKNVQEFVQFH